MKSRVAPNRCARLPSHPSRGGWIEIAIINNADMEQYVPPLAGWVD